MDQQPVQETEFIHLRVEQIPGHAHIVLRKIAQIPLRIGAKAQVQTAIVPLTIVRDKLLVHIAPVSLLAPEQGLTQAAAAQEVVALKTVLAQAVQVTTAGKLRKASNSNRDPEHTVLLLAQYIHVQPVAPAQVIAQVHTVVVVTQAVIVVEVTVPGLQVPLVQEVTHPVVPVHQVVEATLRALLPEVLLRDLAREVLAHLTVLQQGQDS